MSARMLSMALLASLSCTTPDRPEPNWRVEDGEVFVDHPTPVRFEVREVELGVALPTPSVTARVTTLEQSTSPSYPPLAGRVTEVHVRIGDRVREGDKLIRVQTGDLSVLEAEVAATRLHVETKLATVEKLERMVEARLAAENDLTLARAELSEARLAAKTAKTRLRSLSVGQAGESSYWVLASRSGSVVQLDAALGQQVRPDQDVPLATLADLEEVLVVADVSQREAARLRPNTGARVSVPGSTHEPLDGEVEFVSDVVDRERQTVPVRIRVANVDRSLRPNAYVDVAFVADEQAPVVRVPASAVVRDGTRTIVFLALAEGTYQPRAVEVGRRSKTEVEIVRGLEAGERIVTTNALLLLNAIEVEA